MAAVIYDFAIASALILIGQILRSRIKLFQQLFIPASLLAGFLGLLLGDQFLNIIHWSDFSGQYASNLVVMSFVAVGLPGITFNRAEGERVGSYFCYKVATWCMQFSFPVILTCLVLSNLPLGVNDGFGLLLASGFMGGHGTAAAVGATYEKLGFTDATDIAMTFATAGILAGVFGGLIFIKWAAKKGYTMYIRDFSQISPDLRTGMVAKENRTVMGMNTISNTSLDPLCWHLGLMLIPTALGILICSLIAQRTGISLPDYAIGFLIALVMSVLLRKTGLNDYVDSRVIDRIAGACTDYIVFFGVARIRIEIVVRYAVPLVIMLALGILIVFLTVYYFGPRMNKDSWFERSIFVYGYSTGVFAIGMLLLRICDPSNESGTLQDTAFVSAFQTFFELFAWSAGPYMMMSGMGLVFGFGMLGVMIVSIVIAHVCHWWYKIPLDQRKALHLAK